MWGCGEWNAEPPSEMTGGERYWFSTPPPTPNPLLPT